MIAGTPGRRPRWTTTGLPCLRPSEGRVHHRMGCHLQIGQQLLAVLVVECLRVDLRDGSVHAAQPRIALDVADPERRVTHPQSRMSALIRISPRAAPVLLEEHAQPHLGSVELVFWVERTQDFVLANQLIKPRHDGVKRVVASDFVVERALRLCHGTIVPLYAARYFNGSTRMSSARSSRSSTPSLKQAR